MSVIPCKVDPDTLKKVDEVAETLKVKAHTLFPGTNERDFYDGGLFRGAIERIRGQFSASMSDKRDFIKLILNELQDQNLIQDWQSAGGSNRFDYSVKMASGKIAVIELKGCLDGNNTTIFERPPHAQEFVIWSVCQNPAADPKRNAWSGIHTRLSAEIIDKKKQVDGLVIWDMVCGTIGRPCPKIVASPENLTIVGPYSLPPPCIYVFPATIASPRNNPIAAPQSLESVEFLSALSTGFKGVAADCFGVQFEAQNYGNSQQRRTMIVRDGVPVMTSKWTTIKRS